MRVTTSLSLAGLMLWLNGCQTATVHAAVRRDVNMDYVEGVARERAGQPFDDSGDVVPDYLAQLDYDAYRDIRFDSQQALWTEEGLPFRIEFFHPGGLHARTVRINEFTATHEQEIRFNSGFFNYGRNGELPRKLPSSLGYAGLRVRYPLNRKDVYDEVAVFLGASYFRVIGRGQLFGVSARGLAIDTGLDTAEEFPRFREFWLGKPEPGATELTIYALLDSPSVAGAYQFVIKPGADTQVDVRATLFYRSPVRRIGLAPFSSMYYFGENTLEKPVDFRPEVHDSDGVLLLNSEGGALWRPLVNPPGVRTSTFAPGQPAGFGLMQRDREFGHYQDIEAAYHLRPSAWVTPVDMPTGSVTLFEFHADNEFQDNVALFYDPLVSGTPGEPMHVAYTLTFTGADRAPAGFVDATRTGRRMDDPGVYEFVVDFTGGRLADIAEVEVVDPGLSVSGGGELTEPPTVRKNPYNGTWRMVAYVRPTNGEPVELQAQLSLDGEPLTETWSYQWIPARQP